MHLSLLKKVRRWKCVTSKTYKNVTLGADVEIQEFCIIGLPPKGSKDGDLQTKIGADSVIRSHTVIYAGNTIGRHVQTGHWVMLRECNTIGDEVSIGSASDIEHHVKIGDRARIHSKVFIPEYTTIEQDAWIGPNVILTNALYPNAPKTKEYLKGPTIRQGAKIGAGAIILPGVTVGRFALVGAGSMVTKDVPDYAVVAGNPAKVINTIDKLKWPKTGEIAYPGIKQG